MHCDEKYVLGVVSRERPFHACAGGFFICEVCSERGRNVMRTRRWSCSKAVRGERNSPSLVAFGADPCVSPSLMPPPYLAEARLR